MTFKERFFLGEIPFEDIDRYTSRWNFSDETCTLAAYLGLNGEEEDVWISQSDEALEALLEKEKAAYLACPTKILFTDLDGTLLNNNKEISPANREAIRLAREAGHIIVLTTGRPMASILPLAQDLQLDGPGSYIIGFNGSVVYDCGEQRFLMNRTISLDDVLSVFDAAEKAGIHCQSYEENHVLYLRDDEEGRSYFEHTHTPCQIIAGTDELSKEPNKLLLIDLHNHQKLEDFRAAVEPHSVCFFQQYLSGGHSRRDIQGKCPAFSVQLPEHSRGQHGGCRRFRERSVHDPGSGHRRCHGQQHGTGQRGC